MPTFDSIIKQLGCFFCFGAKAWLSKKLKVVVVVLFFNGFLYCTYALMHPHCQTLCYSWILASVAYKAEKPSITSQLQAHMWTSTHGHNDTRDKWANSPGVCLVETQRCVCGNLCRLLGYQILKGKVNPKLPLLFWGHIASRTFSAADPHPNLVVFRGSSLNFISTCLI